MSEPNETPTEPEEIEALREGFQKPESKLPELLPCPFCGGEATLISGSDGVGAIAGCSDCHAQIESLRSSEDVIPKWNTRPAVKLPEKPSELVALAISHPIECQCLSDLVRREVWDFMGPFKTEPDFDMWLANQYKSAPNHLTGLRAVQAALEKEGL